MHPDWQNQIHVYCENYSYSEPEVLQKLTQYTWRKTVNPRQLSGHLQGRFLAHMVHLLQPLKILEIGTLFRSIALLKMPSPIQKLLPLKPMQKLRIRDNSSGKMKPFSQK